MKKCLLLTVAATAMAMAISALGFGAAYASPIISINAPITGSLSFTGNGAGGLSVTQGAHVGGGTDAVDGASSGVITITADSYKTGLQTLGIFPDIGLDQSVLVYINGGNKLVETIIWQSVDDGSVNPHLFGTDVVTAVSGSAVFDAAFSVGEKSTIDIEAATVPTVLDLLAATTGTEATSYSSGEIQFLAAVPEPRALLVMLMAIGTVLMLHRWKHSS